MRELLFHGFDRRAWGDAPYPSVVGTLATPGGKKASCPEDDENPKEWQKRIVVYGKCLALQWPNITYRLEDIGNGLQSGLQWQWPWQWQWHAPAAVGKTTTGEYHRYSWQR